MINQPTIDLHLDELDYWTVSYALSQQLKVVRTEYEVILKGSQEVLTNWERYMLPSTLYDADQKTLRDNVNAWDTLVRSIEYLLKGLDKAHEDYKVQEAEWAKQVAANRRQQWIARESNLAGE